jgi:hypothetical protein
MSTSPNFIPSADRVTREAALDQAIQAMYDEDMEIAVAIVNNLRGTLQMTVEGHATTAHQNTATEDCSS